jgi:DNA mismatch repair ATPase MutS
LFIIFIIYIVGKGTSSRDGCGIAGALLEKLDEKQISGIFSTHLHELFKISLNFKHVTYKKMGIDINNITNELKWSYLLEDGKCTNSMALSTAKDYGIPNEVLERASELIDEFDYIYNSTDSLDFNNNNNFNNNHSIIINNNKFQLENLIKFMQDVFNEFNLDTDGDNRLNKIKYGNCYFFYFF